MLVILITWNGLTVIQDTVIRQSLADAFAENWRLCL